MILAPPIPDIGNMVELVFENPVFIPRKHPWQSYAQQKRMAKKRRNIKRMKVRKKKT
jgi:hypothetical protein